MTTIPYKYHLQGIGRIQSGIYDFAITHGDNAQVYIDSLGVWHLDGGDCGEDDIIEFQINGGLWCIYMHSDGSWSVDYSLLKYDEVRDANIGWVWGVVDPKDPFRLRLSGHSIVLEKSKGTPLSMTDYYDATIKNWKI
jgi:hypothetical protein